MAKKFQKVFKHDLVRSTATTTIIFGTHIGCIHVNKAHIKYLKFIREKLALNISANDLLIRDNVRCHHIYSY